MTEVVIEGPEAPPPSGREVREAASTGDFKSAIGALMAMVANRALAEFDKHGVHFVRGPGAEEVGASVLLQQAYIAAQHEADRRAGKPEHERLDAAATALGAAAMLRERLDAGLNSQDPANALSELIFLGAVLGQSDVVMVGHIDGVWAAAEKARRHHEGRAANAKAVAAAKTERWHALALDKANRVYAQQPSVTNDQLASMIKDALYDETPSHERVLAFVRKQRKAGAIPPRRQIK